jgi:mannosyltransferase
VRPLPLLPPAALAALGTTQLLRGHGLWFDELFTAAVVDRPLGEVVRLVAEGRGPEPWLTTPPSFNGPYYVVAWLWSQPLGVSATGLRLLSLLAAVLSVAVLVRAVSLLVSPRVGVVAGLLAATSPLLVVQATEARPYGLALLAVTVALLGAARDDLRLLALGTLSAGLLHWFALPAAGAIALGWAASRRRVAPVVVAGAAALPTLGLVALALARGAEGGGHLSTTGLLVPWEALWAWTGGGLLLVATVAAVVLGARLAAAGPGPVADTGPVPAAARSGGPGGRALWWCWLLAPVLLVTAVDLARPVFVPRYLLPSLLALAVLAALGAAGRRWLLAALLVGAVVADARALSRPRWERADRVAAYLLAEQSAGEPVVAADERSAVGMAFYAGGTRLGADLRLPPDDPPAGATRVWLVRELAPDGSTVPTDDEDLLRAAGLRVERTVTFRAVKTDLVVQLWTR